MNIAFNAEAEWALSKMTPAQKLLMRRHGKKIYLGREQREGWSGALPFYLFWCEDCGHFAKDYPHGYIERQYLLCSNCKARHSFVPWWVEFALCWQILRSLVRAPLRRK